MRVTDSIWFTSVNSCVGVVLGVDDTTGEHKAYIGVGTGASERMDTESVKDYGSLLKLDTVLRIVTHLGGKDK